MVDSLVVGQQLSETGLAVIGYALPLLYLYYAAYSCIGIGGAVEFSKLTGAGKFNEAKKIASVVLEVSFIISAIFFIIGLFFTPVVVKLLGVSGDDAEVYRLSVIYCRILLCGSPLYFLNFAFFQLVRVDNREKYAGVAFIIGYISDFILSIVFVAVLKLGVAGTASASLIGQAISLCILLFHFTHKNRIIEAKIYRFRPKDILPAIKVGFTGTTEYLYSGIFIMVANHLIARLVGTTGVAVFDVLTSASYLALVIFEATSESLIPLAGTLYGERNIPELKKSLSYATKVGMTIGTAVLCLLAIFAKDFYILFGINSPEALSLGVIAVRSYCASTFLSGLFFIYAGYCQATGREKLTFIILTLKSCVYPILFAFVFSFTNQYLFWLLYPTAEIATLITVIFLHHRGKLSYQEPLSEDCLYTGTLSYSLKELSDTLNGVEALGKKHNLPSKRIQYLMHTLEEVCVATKENALLYKANEDAFYIYVTVVIENSGDVRVCIRDNATTYNPFGLGTKKITAATVDNSDIVSGLGIRMVKANAKEFRYRRYMHFNTMIVVI